MLACWRMRNVPVVVETRALEQELRLLCAPVSLPSPFVRT
jgi:hypothetical protein